jgi:hypothetical protein
MGNDWCVAFSPLVRCALGVAAVVAMTTTGAMACGSDDESTDAPSPTTSSTTAVTSPADQPAMDADTAVSGFMNARVGGGGAEDYLTTEGADVYGSTIELYDVVSFVLTGLQAVDANSFQATVDITNTDGGTRTETLFVGPGTTVNGTTASMVIRGGVVD